MADFTQRYVIVQMLEDAPDEFPSKHWPLHCTVVGLFDVDCSTAELISCFETAVSNLPGTASKTVGRELIGPDHDIPVRLVEKTPGLDNIHRELIAMLEDTGISLVTPEYNLNGYKPHITEQGDKVFAADQQVVFDQLALIDRFPGGDHLVRKVIASVRLH